MPERILKAFQAPKSTRTKLRKDHGVGFRGALIVFREHDHGEVTLEFITDEREIRKVRLASEAESGEDGD